MKPVRVAVAVAVLVSTCSTTADHTSAPPLSSLARRSAEKAVAWPDGCAKLTDAFDAWAPTTLDTYFDPAELPQLLDLGEAFADQVAAVEDLPVLELAGAITTYIEELELLLTEYEEGGWPNTFEAELALANVVEQVQTIARTACAYRRR